MRTTRRHSWSLSFLLLLSACGVDNCSEDTVAYPSDIDGGQLLENAIHARITQNGLDFIRNKLAVFLSSTYFSLDDEGYILYTIESDERSPGSSIQLASEEIYTSRLRIHLDTLIQNMDMSWIENDAQNRPGMRIAISNTQLLFDVAIFNNTDALPPAACLITSGADDAPIIVNKIAFDVRYSIDLSSSHPELDSAIENVQIDLGTNVEAAAQNLDVEPCDGSTTSCDNPICQQSDADCEEICHLIDLFTQLGGFVDSLLGPLLDQMAPIIGEELATSIGEIASQVPVGIETQFTFDDFLAGGITGASALHAKVSPTPEVSVQGVASGKGLQMTFNAGVTTTAQTTCGGTLDVPDFGSISAPEIDYPGFLEFLTEDQSSIFAPYHMAISIGQPFFNQAAWTIYQTGVFCMRLSPETVDAFVGDVIDLESQLLMGLDSRLAQIGPADAPLLIQLQAQEVPRIELGSGRALGEDYYEPLIKILINNLAVNIYMLMDDGHRRILETSLNLEIAFGIEQDTNQMMQIVLENFALTSIEQTYNEILPDADFSELIEVIVQIMIDQITTENMAFGFDLDDVVSEQIGIPVTLKINALRRDLGATNPYLSVYATLCDAAAQEDASNVLCAQQALPSAGNTTPFAFHILSSDDPTEHAKQPLRLKLEHPDPQQYFYQYRIDQGIWSGFQTTETNTIELKNPRLRLIGEHTVELRIRTKKWPHAAQNAIATIYIDHIPPTLNIHRGEKGLHLSTQDAGTSQDIQLWGHFLGPKETPWKRVGAFIPYDAIQSTSAEFFAQDKTGNRSEIIVLELLDMGKRKNVAQQNLKAQGCQANQTYAYSALLFFVLFIFRRSRHPRAVRAAHPYLKDRNHKF